ncbi:unnamed protein product [Prorocentrum cordatum]|uniref:Uncharacterized protein n=1 Tax=Prorocentrum cordatum TaxID=2364126 RepID=A0ABN9STL3_9DINO|nr:unnamed protein product [Polarella glacialis]
MSAATVPSGEPDDDGADRESRAGEASAGVQGRGERAAEGSAGPLRGPGESAGGRAALSVARRSTVSTRKSRGTGLHGDEVVPSAFERFLVEHACWACWGFFVTALVLVLVFVAMIPAGAIVVTHQSVWDVRSNLDVMKSHAFAEAKKDMSDHDLEGNETDSERSGFFKSLTIVYEVQGGNIFSEENQEKMRKVENALVNSPKWQDYCMLITSSSDTPQTVCTGGASALRFTHTGPAIQTAHLNDGFGPCGGSPAEASRCQAAPFTVGAPPCVSRAFSPVADAAALDGAFAEELWCTCCAEPDSPGCDGAAAACGHDANEALCGQTVQQARRDKRRAHISAAILLRDRGGAARPVLVRARGAHRR